MNRHLRVFTLTRATALGLLLGPSVAAVSTAQEPPEEHQMRREIVVVGSQPTHRRLIFDQLAERGYLGVLLLDLTPELRRHFAAPEDSGVLVSRVLSDSPAAAAGVEVGDVVTAIDGSPLSTTGQLVGRIGRHRQGEQVELQLIRERRPLTLQATLAQAARRQVEVGQFVWKSGEEDSFVVELGPESIEQVISVDPVTINESVSQLLQRLQEDGEPPGRLHIAVEQRRELEKRIAELEARLRQMERLLQDRQEDD